MDKWGTHYATLHILCVFEILHDKRIQQQTKSNAKENLVFSSQASEVLKQRNAL